MFCGRYPLRRPPYLISKNRAGVPKLVRVRAPHLPACGLHAGPPVRLSPPAAERGVEFWLDTEEHARAGLRLAAADGDAARRAAEPGGHLQVCCRVPHPGAPGGRRRGPPRVHDLAGVHPGLAGDPLLACMLSCLTSIQLVLYPMLDPHMTRTHAARVIMPLAFRCRFCCLVTLHAAKERRL